MHAVLLCILVIILFIIFIIWLCLELKERKDQYEYRMPHNVFRLLIPTWILGTWLVLSFFTIKDGEIIDRNVVFTVGDEIPIQIIVIDETTKWQTNPQKKFHANPKFININSRFGGILPEGTVVERKYSIAQESLGVSYAGIRQDDLVLVLPNNSRVANANGNTDP